MADCKGAEFYTLEGKPAGRIKEINSGYFTALKRGLVTDEEFRIPNSSISAVERHDNATIVKLNLKEEQLKHGYEFTRGRRNSEFVSGAAEWEPKIPVEKQVIRYESSHPVEEGGTADRPSAISECLYDMCDEKSGSPSKLQEHRASRHKARTGI
jgi:hypothetical protein